MKASRVLFVLAAYFITSATASTNDNDIDGNVGGTSPLPIVMWHGMGDCCCNPLSLGYIKDLLQKHIPSVYVHSLMLGSNVAADTEAGFFANVNNQVEQVCQIIAGDQKLKNGYNALGFSQGAQFLRAVAQRCPQGIKHLISFGGQHQGVFGLPQCPGEDHTVCDYARRLLNYGAYIPWIQRMLVQAQYWHDPLDEASYVAKNIFLADINNEREPRNETYAENLRSLDKLVLVRFTEDTMVDPRGTEWFQFYKPGQAMEIQPLNETRLYREDWIGLRTLDESGRLVFLMSEGNHLQFTEEFFVQQIIKPFLSSHD